MSFDNNRLTREEVFEGVDHNNKWDNFVHHNPFCGPLTEMAIIGFQMRTPRYSFFKTGAILDLRDNLTLFSALSEKKGVGYAVLNDFCATLYHPISLANRAIISVFGEPSKDNYSTLYGWGGSISGE